MTLNLPPTPGLIFAALISPTGHLLASVGENSVDAAIVSVLAQGAVAALSDLGQRSQLGDCGEVAATCQAGGLFILADRSGHLALLHHAHLASVDQLRQHARAMLAATVNPTPPTTSRRQSLMEALNVGPP
ncbi:MAG TPA: roadblock/LC7 domain-containing protein [Prosthecobacter sp.]|nr:roadblock/LC7 domain-containing protein [Prosthecobacter sp.]